MAQTLLEIALGLVLIGPPVVLMSIEIIKGPKS